jgi:hypothetical protein
VHARRAAEHRQIHQHVQDRAFDEAVLANARHLARTPMFILAEMAADTEPASIRGALNMISSMGATGHGRDRDRRHPVADERSSYQS